MVRRKAEAFEPVTMGHIRGHGCRDLLVYCNSGRCHHSATMRQARGFMRVCERIEEHAREARYPPQQAADVRALIWVLLRAPRFEGANHANDHDNRSRHRQIGFSGPRC